MNEALQLLAGSIKTAHLERHISMQNIAERAGISRDLLYRIDRRDPSCSIGLVFDIATLVFVTLFHRNYDDLIVKNKMVDDKLAFLPRRSGRVTVEMDDDF